MKSKIFKPKTIVALALALFMVMPMLLVVMPMAHAASTDPYISIVPTGTAGVTSQNNLPAVAVGNTFEVDVRIDNTASVAAGINGYSYKLTWDPTVLSLVEFDDPAANVTAFLHLPNPAHGASITSIPQTGSNYAVANDIIVPSTSSGGNLSLSCGGSGVLSQIEFQVLTTGQSALTLSASAAGQAVLTSPDGAGGSNPVNSNLVNAMYNQQFTQINVFQSGTQSSTVTYAGTSQSEIGAMVSVDIAINNPFAEPVWGWNINVNWNAAVLQLEGITEGNYLTSVNQYNSSNPSSATVFIPGFIDNTVGTVRQGISDLYLNNLTQTASSGVLCTLTFEIINFANSAISVSAGSPTLIDNYGNAQTVQQYNPAEFVTLPPPAAQAPTAIIVNSGSSTYSQALAPFVFSGTTSLPGYDPTANPSNPNIPITTYTWTQTAGSPISDISYSNNGATISFEGPATIATPFTLQLTVTTATTSDSSYVNTNSASITINVGVILPGPAGPAVDVYIINNNPTNTTYPYKSPTGLGQYNSTVDAYAPQEVMNLGAYVTFNNASVWDKLVTFTVTSSTGTVIGTFVGTSDDTGHTYATYRLPNFDSAVMPFGTYTITATTTISQLITSDSFTFQYGWILNITSVTPNTPLVARGTVPTGLGTETMNVTIANISLQNQTYFMTYTVQDSQGVAIFAAETGSMTAAATSTSSGSTTTAVNDIPLSIPSYAFTGQATISVNIFNADPAVPADLALPYCPQETATFNIGIVPPS